VTVGLLLCRDKSDRVVRYALAGSNQPIAIAGHDLLPAAERAALPSDADLSRALETLNQPRNSSLRDRLPKADRHGSGAA
jgi:uncharacterized protein (DUF2336 family)